MQVNILTGRRPSSGVVTFLLLFVGCACSGSQFGLLLGSRAQVFGGVILVGIGLKIFIEHMFG